MVLAELRVTILSHDSFRFANLKMNVGPSDLK